MDVQGNSHLAELMGSKRSSAYVLWLAVYL